MRSFTIGSLFAAAAVTIGTFGSPVSASGGPPITATEVLKDVTFVDADVNPCTGDPGIVTTVVNAVFHITEFSDGRVHVTGTATGSFEFDATDPAAVDYAGHFTQWFGENHNPTVDNSTFTFTVIGVGTDGSTIRFHDTAHITVIGSDLVVGFEKARCG
jgi:hypothetical protein